MMPVWCAVTKNGSGVLPYMRFVIHPATRPNAPSRRGASILLMPDPPRSCDCKKPQWEHHVQRESADLRDGVAGREVVERRRVVDEMRQRGHGVRHERGLNQPAVEPRER